ncbi:MAG TPA: tetratricopeptide repeat protein [Arenimonas sp.]|nr:tetratricopeptide repeat protein [Arenimonas sp.]
MLHDDHRVITGDPRVRDWATWWADVPGGIRPLLKLSFLLNWRSGSGTPGFFAVNLALHLGNALLLWRIGIHLLTRLVPGQASLAARVAWLAALLFALHPVQAEAVTYLSGRSSPLMASFLLGSFLLWLRRPGRPWPELAAGMAFLLALASRETAIVLPAVMALVLWLVPGSPHGAWRLPLVLLAVVAMAAVAVLAGHPGYRAFFAGAFAHGEPLTHLPEAARGLHYLLLRWLGLQPGSIDPVLPEGAPLWLPLATLGALAWLASTRERRRRSAWAVFGLGWAFLHLAPMYSLVPRAEPANDRHLYLAAWGLALPVAWMLCRLAASTGWRRRTAVALASCLLVVQWTGLQSRNRVLGDETAVWTEVVNRAPAHARGWHNLGLALHRQGRLQEACVFYRRALSLQENGFSRRALAALAQEGLPDCPGPTSPTPARGL